MTWILLALACLGLGVAVGWYYGAPTRNLAKTLEERSRVLHELAEGDVENVAHELEVAAEADTRDMTVFMALAALDRRRGRVERAKALHRTVLANSTLTPGQRVDALVGLGRDLLQQGNERAAVGALVRASSLAPRSVATLESLARALEQAGAWERAAAAWERHEKLVEGRRRRESKIGRGHALAGQALLALSEGDDKKARKLVDRATELAPDSGHVWTAKARVESAVGVPGRALEAWQAAWELTPGGAHVVVPEAWTWATEQGAAGDLVERMLVSLRTTQDPDLVVALADRVARQHPDQAAAALERVGERSALATLSLVRLRIARGQRDQAREAAMRELEPPRLLCRSCGHGMERFSFRCDKCGSWDSVTSEGLGRPAEPSPPASTSTTIS